MTNVYIFLTGTSCGCEKYCDTVMAIKIGVDEEVCVDVWVKKANNFETMVGIPSPPNIF